MTKTFAERCHIAQQFLPDAQYKALLTNLHAEMLAALADQPAPVQQEPVAWISEIRCIGPEYGKKRYSELPIQSLQPGYYAHTPLYTTPQAPAAREWAGLTEEEKTELRRKHYPLPLLLMDATEAKLKEKNHD